MQHIARLLSDCIRPQTDQVARYGGEEFVITMPGTDLTGALKVAERIHQAITHLQLPHEWSAHGYVTLSMGISGTLPSSQKIFFQLCWILPTRSFMPPRPKAAIPTASDPTTKRDVHNKSTNSRPIHPSTAADMVQSLQPRDILNPVP